MEFKDNRHFTGFGGPTGEGGVREGYKWEPDGLAQARYAALRAKKEKVGPEGPLARIGRILRHLLSEV